MFWGVPLVGFAIAFGFYPSDQGLIYNLVGWLISSFYTFVMWFGSRTIFIHHRRNYPNRSNNKERLIRQNVWGVLYVVIAGVILNYIESLFGTDPNRSILQASTAIISLNFYVMFQAIYEGIYYLNKLHETEQRAKDLERENTQSQLETLKNQINPHFLFNSLNTLSAIIPEDAELSVAFVDKLAYVYRYILEIREKEIITLEEELEYIKSYLFLLKIRFGENFQVSMDLDDEAKKKKIVPLSLQILIENAIKHNVVSKKKPLHIEILTKDNNKLVVKNNLQKKNSIIQSTHVGLQNISNRYKLLSGDSIEVEESAEVFQVVIPLI